MSQKQEPAKPKGQMGITVALSTLLLIGYVLSVGPAIQLEAKGYLPSSTMAWVYWPVDKLCNVFPPAGRALHWYVAQWDD